MKKVMSRFGSLVRRYSGRVAALAVILCAGSALATDPTGMLETFSVETAGVDVKAVMVTVIGIVGVVYGAAMGFVFLRWVYRKVVGALGR